MKEAPAEIIRAKGFINSHDKKYLLQYVGSKTEIEEKDWKTGEIKESAILFLATKFDDTDWQKKLSALVS